MLPEIAQVTLSPYASGILFFIRQFQTGNLIITLHLVPKPVLLVVNVLFHVVILQIRLIPAIQSFRLITKAAREATSLRSASLWGLLFFAARIENGACMWYNHTNKTAVSFQTPGSVVAAHLRGSAAKRVSRNYGRAGARP